MNRRTFLWASGSGAALLFSGITGMGKDQVMATNRARAWMKDFSRLENRNQNRSDVIATHGMVCTSQPLASLAGLDILRKGGNAIDAAVGANAMLGLVEPMSCGLGGDLFAILWVEKERKLFGLNASGRAPANWSIDAAKSLDLTEIPGRSPLSWSVPGCARGWGLLLERFGQIGIKEVLAPVIQYAREGFPLSPQIASNWGFNPKDSPTLGETYLPEGTAPQCGDLFRNPELASTLEILARDGATAFYQGEIAERIVKFSQEQGGRFEIGDFHNHKADWVEPVSTSYRGFDVWELPPNGQGIAALQILNLLETFDIGALEMNSAQHLHLFIEAKKLVYEDRAVFYADMDLTDVPIDWLISKEYANERAKLIDPARAAERVLPGKAPGSETIYLTASDGEGNIVSLIQSIYAGWGSRFIPDHLGFALQNRGELFSLNPADRNCLKPGKRPFHTIIPAFVTGQGRPVYSFGVMGGDFQPQGHTQVLMNLIDFGLSPQQAGEQPRIQHSGSSTPTGIVMKGSGTVTLENLIPESVRAQLVEMGHQVKEGVGSFGSYQGIWREDNPLRYFGGSDPRHDGCAMGY